MPHVLLVDDDGLVIKTLSRCLAVSGYEVSCARNGLEALRVLQDGSVDVVVSDVQMPVMNGLELLAELRLIAPLLPVILMSGAFDDDTESGMMSRGAWEFLQKPTGPERLERTIAAALDHSRRVVRDVAG